MRESIKNLVSALVPLDEIELQHLSEAMTWLASNKEIFRIQKPAFPNPHLVCYFLLIDLEKKKVLLVNHKKANLWLPSGGHVEINEHPKETVLREAKEELQIEANFLSDLPLFLTSTETVGDDIHTDITLWYVLKGSISDSILFDREEFHDVRWFDMNEIPLQTDPHLQRFLNKLKTQIQI
jgi:8-oxo-dGTP pyrophosphatase MutT (NUDIX family)